MRIEVWFKRSGYDNMNSHLRIDIDLSTYDMFSDPHDVYIKRHIHGIVDRVSNFINSELDYIRSIFPEKFAEQVVPEIEISGLSPYVSYAVYSKVMKKLGVKPYVI